MSVEATHSAPAETKAEMADRLAQTAHESLWHTGTWRDCGFGPCHTEARRLGATDG